MSHVSAYTTEVTFRTVAAGGELTDDPAWEILQAAVQAAIEEHGGKVDETVRDIFGRPQRCDLALHVPHLRGGLGMMIDRRSGQLSFLYDDYGKAEEYRALRDEILQNFAALAVSRALRTLHYQVDVDASGTGEDKRVLVRGVLA